jgi:alpha-mannosidase
VENTLGLAPKISLLSAGPAVQRYRIDYDWSLPECLDDLRRKRTETRLTCPVSVVLSLAQGVPRLDLEVTFDNHARDHRLRMVFPSDVMADVSHASAQFDVVAHPVRVTPVPDQAWVEDSPTTFPQQDWVDLSDGQRGLCVITRGLPEYEVLDTDRREMAVTLMRAVGYLGAGSELQTAAVGAGPNIATPEAQIQRKLTFSLSVLPHSGTWDQAEVWRQALAHNNPPRGYSTAMDKNERARIYGIGPSSHSFLKVEGQNVILSSVKKAEISEALILRLYNPSNVVTQAAIQLPFVPTSVQLAKLDEQPRSTASLETIPVLGTGGRLQITLAPKIIITLRMERV